MTEAKAKELTLKIFRVILEEINGYDASEIIDNNLAEDCETSQEFQKIQAIIQSHR